MKTAPLGEIAKIERDSIQPEDIQSGTLYVGLENITGKGEFEDVSTVENGELNSSKYQFNSEHILYGKLRPYLRKIALPTFEGICSTDILPIKSGTAVDKRYLYYFLRQPQMVDLATARSTGVNLPRLSPRQLVKFEIPLPPLPEQKRIAAVLDKADALRAKRRAALAKLDTLLQATFLDMFGDPVTNPMGWEVKQFGEVLDLITYGLTRRPKYHEDGIPLVSAREIRMGFVDYASAPKISVEDFHKVSDKGKPNKGDILFSKTGTIGHCAEIDSVQTFAITQNAARMRFNQNFLENAFVISYLRSSYFIELASRNAKGNAVKDLQLGVIKRFPIYLPPLPLQRRFADTVAKIEIVKQVNIASLNKLNELFHSLQKRAFKGEL